MKRKNLNFAVAYLVLVAPTLLGLAAVLISKQTLAAPVSVGGIWKLQAIGDNAFLPCKKFMATADVSFTILQSGKTFTLTFARPAMFSGSGTVQATTIKASMLPTATWAKEAGCNERRALALTATVDSDMNPQSLRGALLVEDCPACTPIRFDAVREIQAKTQGSN